MNLGNGLLKTDTHGAIEIPEEFLLRANDPNEIIGWVYADRPEPLPKISSCSITEYK